MSFGLERIHGIVDAKTDEETTRLLTGNAVPGGSVFFLYTGFERYTNKWGNPNVFLNDNSTLEDKARVVGTPFFTDPDSGPADVWNWAHQDEPWTHWVYTMERHDLRHWGYVLWDLSRLEATGTFREPWTDEVDETPDSESSQAASPPE